MKTRRVLSNSGVTLIELMVAIVITGIVLAGSYEVFVNLHNWWISTGIKSEMGQNARAALTVLTQDIEAAGSKQSGYGDSQKAAIGITTASLNAIELDEYKYYPVQIPGESTSGSEHTMVYYHIATDPATGYSNLYRKLAAGNSAFQDVMSQPDQLVAENISNITFQYFDQYNNNLTNVTPFGPITPYTGAPGTSPDSRLSQIRRISVSVTATPSKADPARNNTFDQPITLNASVVVKNLYVQEVLGSSQPPAIPTGLNVVDTRSCTRKLWVRWNANIEPDLAGYTLFYGLNGQMTVPVQDLANPSHPQVYLNASDVLITKSNAASANTYSITIEAYSSNGLPSGKSAPVSGNPSNLGYPNLGNITSFGGANDTTVNPRKPSPPTNLVAAAVGYNQLVLTWKAPTDGSATVGYRLYRNMSSFALNTDITSKLIADESKLGPNTTTFTDTGSDIIIPDAPSQLTGCTPYYYALCSVNCDDSLVNYYLYKTTGSDFAVGSGVPASNTPPGAPDIHTGTKPGWQRIFITLTNPYRSSTLGGITAYPGFDHTCIYFSKTGYPTLQSNGTVTGGTLIPESDCGTPGWFKNEGMQQVLFDHEPSGPTPPSLVNNISYYLLAVSYDKCGNANADKDVSQTLTQLCGDDPDFPGAPPPYNTYTLSTYGAAYYPGESYSKDVATILPNGAKGAITICGDDIELNWNYPWANGTSGYPAIIDFAGFHIYRGSTMGDTSYELTTGIPQWSTMRTDGGLLDGSTYWYTIKTTDCAYENTPPSDPEYANFRTNDISDGINIGPVTPGNIILYPGSLSSPLAPQNFVVTASDSQNPLFPSTFTYHNNVTFYIQNTSAGSQTIRGITASWGNPNVVLNKITIGPGPLTSLATIDAGSVGPGVYVSTNNADVKDVATGPSSPSTYIPVTLRFTNQDGSVNGYTDMRGDSIQLALDVQNDNSSINACAAMPINFGVPSGPSTGILFQSSPGLYGTNSYEVPGPSGTATDMDMQTVGGPGSAMTISGAIFDNSGSLFTSGVNQGFNYVNMYYAYASPTPDTPPPPGSYTMIQLNNIGGNYYSCATPNLLENQVMWYFLVAQDKTGNFDRSPQAEDGSNAFYVIPPYDPCDPKAIPNAPVLSGSVMGGTAVNLTWTMSPDYTDTVPIPSSDPLTYTVYRETMQTPTWTAIASGLSSMTYTDNSISSTINSYDYVYKVVALNSCSPVAHQSADSNYYRECQGSLASDCSGFFSVSDSTNPSLASGYSSVGDTETVSLSSVCADVGNGVQDTQYFRVETSSSNSMDIPVLEAWPADSGYFVGTFTTSLTAATSVIASPPVLKIAANSVVTVSVLPSQGSATQDCPTSVYFGCDDGTPKAPSNFTAATVSGHTTELKLTWSVPTLNTNGTNIVNLAGYEIDYSTSSSFSSFTAVPITPSTTTTTTLTGLSSTNTYYLRIRAYDGCSTVNYSAYQASSPASIKP